LIHEDTTLHLRTRVYFLRLINRNTFNTIGYMKDIVEVLKADLSNSNSVDVAEGLSNLSSYVIQGSILIIGGLLFYVINFYLEL